MESSGGWQFWLEDSGCVRQFMVAEPDEIKARERLRKTQPKGNILSRKIVPESVIQILKMKPSVNGCQNPRKDGGRVSSADAGSR